MKRLLLATAFAVATATPAAAITFTYTGSIVTWTVPADGTYTITATGAQGGQGRNLSFAPVFTGGRGARVGADIVLTAGTILQIAVGGQGGSSFSSTGGGGGGGGGSFVVGPGNTALLVAGGGGGVSQESAENGWDATLAAPLSGDSIISEMIDDILVTTRVAGGFPMLNSGLGGPAASPSPNAGGGAGFYTNGQNATNLGSVLAPGGASWFAGLAGGAVPDCPAFPVTSNSSGGFGGGSAATCYFGGGGGGGYGGGQGGINAGGGAGSYIAVQFEDILLSGQASAVGVGYGNGLVTITGAAIQEVTTPEPASATLALLGLFGLAALRRRA